MTKIVRQAGDPLWVEASRRLGRIQLEILALSPANVSVAYELNVLNGSNISKYRGISLLVEGIRVCLAEISIDNASSIQLSVNSDDGIRYIRDVPLTSITSAGV
jgi:hypothetical protein